MKIGLQILCYCALFTSFLTAQFQDNFDDGNLTENQTWLGDTDNFIVNDDNRLQLMAPDAGESFLYTTTEFIQDQTWKFDFEMDFAPSSSNKLRIYLAIDQLDLNNANGYFMEIGEDGSNDALVFYRITNGIEVEIARGIDGNMGAAPARVQLVIDRVDGLWNVKTDYSVSNALTDELMFNDDIHQNMSSGYFGFDCAYTSSRKDKFSFDNIDVNPFTPDVEGPEIVQFVPVDSKNLVFTFNEFIDETTISNIVVSIDPNATIQSIEPENMPTNAIRIKLTEALESGPEYTLNISGAQDLLGNVMLPQSFNFVISVEAEPGELLINEVLFDPYPSANDFIELVNNSEKILNLKNLEIHNTQKEEQILIQKDIILNPGEYIAFTTDVDQLESLYDVPSEARIISQAIPSMNNDMGNVTIYNTSGMMIDSLDYSDEWHYALIDDTEGVSLERLFFDGKTNEKSNWFSGSSTSLFATPGYKNANAQNGQLGSKELLSIEDPVFSPNGDGDKDILICTVNPEREGYTAVIEIYNLSGQKIRTLANNELLGVDNTVVWDGLTDEGHLANLGHYIIFLKAFDNAGSVIQQKKVIKLLDFL